MDRRSPVFGCWLAPDSSYISPELPSIQAEPSNPVETTAPPTSGINICVNALLLSICTSIFRDWKEAHRYLQIFHSLLSVPAVCLKGRLTLLYSHSMYCLLHLQKHPIGHLKIPWHHWVANGESILSCLLVGALHGCRHLLGWGSARQDCWRSHWCGWGRHWAC